MATLTLDGDVVRVDGQVLQGIKLLGYSPSRWAMLISVDWLAAHELAHGNEGPHKTFMANMAQVLAPKIPPAQPSSAKDPSKPNERLPKRARPYLRYTEEQMAAAWAKTAIGCGYDHASAGYIRLHLSRDALVEMYRQPRHLKAVYASLLRDADQGQPNSARALSHASSAYQGDVLSTSRLRPYEGYTDQQMKAAVRAIRITLADARIAYGRFTITLRRDSLLTLQRGSEHTRLAFAYLLKLRDAECAQKSSPALHGTSS